MTDEVTAAATSEVPTPAASPEPTRDERAATLIADFEHAAATSSPISNVMMNELKALLLPQAQMMVDRRLPAGTIMGEAQSST